MSYVMAMEPNGRNTRGLDEVWFFNAETGESQFFGTGDDTLLGPQRAMGIVRSEDTRTDWVAGSQSGQFQVVEPVPVVIDGELWWHSKVVPVDQTDVTRNVFVSASGGTAVELSKTTAVVEFMTGKISSLSTMPIRLAPSLPKITPTLRTSSWSQTRTATKSSGFPSVRASK
jgi:hypothetical protein